MTHALLIIDMQQGSFGTATPRHDAAGLVGRLNRLAGTVRETGGAVVFIQHDGPPGDPHHPDLPWCVLVRTCGWCETAALRLSTKSPPCEHRTSVLNVAL